MLAWLHLCLGTLLHGAVVTNHAISKCIYYGS